MFILSEGDVFGKQAKLVFAEFLLILFMKKVFSGLRDSGIKFYSWDYYFLFHGYACLSHR